MIIEVFIKQIFRAPEESPHRAVQCGRGGGEVDLFLL
jgi:hypothetical protein